jgi:DNA-binding response OmpR family regulator
VSSMLVVEDDEAIAEVVAYQLRRDGHAVEVAIDGVQALECLKRAPVDLVILDLMLPRISGLEVLRVLRRESNTPVIILSARESDADQVAALDLGADDYVTKPFSIRQLLARVGAVLRRATSPTAAAAPLPTHGLVIDATTHEVRKNGEVVTLAPKEFELLVFLAERANRVCSRDAILNAVWGYGYEGETRTVDVHVHWLRRKLEDDPTNPQFVVTVRQYGYKLVTQPLGHPLQVALVAAQNPTATSSGGASA